MKRVVVSAGTRGRIWKYNAKPIPRTTKQIANDALNAEFATDDEVKVKESKQAPLSTDGMLDYNKNYKAKTDTVFALDNTDPIAIQQGFLLMDPMRADLYKRVDAHPLFDKLGPYSAEILSIAIKHSRGKKIENKILYFSTFLKIDIEKSIITMISVPTHRTKVCDIK
jgi:hypothetical protein